MLLQQSIHLHTSAKHLGKVQNALLLTVFIKSTSESFISVFVPIFLLTHGLNLRQVFTYSLLVFVFTFLSMLLGLKLNQYIGMKKTLVLGIITTIVFYMALHAFTSGFNFMLIGIIDGFALGFYFAAYNMLLTRAMKRGKEGRGASKQQIAGILAGICGPTIGAVLVHDVSYQGLFLVVTGLLVIAPIPLFFSKDIKAKKQSLELAKLLSTKPNRVNRITFVQGMLFASTTFWPVYLYLHYPNIVALGLLATVTSALTIMMTFIVGSSVDRKQRLAYRLGGLLYAPTWIGRLIFISPLGLGLSSLVGSLLAIGPTMAVNKDIFHVAKTSKNQSAHFAMTELYMDGGRVALFGLAVLVPSLVFIFVLASIATLFYVVSAPHTKRTRATGMQTAT